LIFEKIKQNIPDAPPQIQHSQIVSKSSSTGAAPTGDKATSNKAVTLTKEKRNPEEWLNSLADQRGTGREFRLVVKVARELGLFARFQNNWWIVMITNPRNKNDALIEISSDLAIWINSKQIAEYTGNPAELINEKLNYGSRISTDQVDQWIENLKELFSHQNGG